MTIDWKASADMNDMSENDLKTWFDKYPGSGKKIVAICDTPGCGKIRTLPYQSYSGICKSCGKVRYYEDPDNRKKDSDAVKNAHKNDPTIRSKMSISTKESYKKDPTLKRRMLDTFKNTLKNDPTISIRASEKSKERYNKMSDPGGEIVKHHVSYDFGRPDILTVEITRRFHGQIHNPKGRGVHERGYSLID